jgi:hypothetical protein
MQSVIVIFFALALLTLSFNELTQNQNPTLIQPTVVPIDEVKLAVPAGLAFWPGERQLPEIELFMPDVLGVNNKANDDAELTYRNVLKHPSQAGTYLMACVLYSALYQKSPEGNIFTAGLDKDIALKLQKLS